MEKTQPICLKQPNLKRMQYIRWGVEFLFFPLLILFVSLPTFRLSMRCFALLLPAMIFSYTQQLETYICKEPNLYGCLHLSSIVLCGYPFGGVDFVQLFCTLSSPPCQVVLPLAWLHSSHSWFQPPSSSPPDNTVSINGAVCNCNWPSMLQIYC